MEATDKYLTIREKSEGIFRDRGSRFLAFAQPALSPGECMSQLESLRRTYRDARHHCYAYRLNPEDELFRYADDGEPGGTAGRPIYEQLKAFDLFNVNLVVVRYFGGTLLGTGGLYQAYKKAAANALSQAGVVETVITRDIEIKFSYTSMGQVMQWIEREKYSMVEKEFGSSGRIIIRVPKSISDEILEKINRLPHTRGILLNKL